jgi:putative PIN family toxin of toxin-antitoxin system
MRMVLDTNVVVAALRSPRGASAALIRQVRAEKVQILMSVPLALEYEAICKRAEHILAAGISAQDANVFVTALVAMAEPVSLFYLWRPQLRDPDDEMVLEAAVNGQADVIVTFNRKDYAGVSEQFNVQVLTPQEVL